MREKVTSCPDYILATRTEFTLTNLVKIKLPSIFQVNSILISILGFRRGWGAGRGNHQWLSP